MSLEYKKVIVNRQHQDLDENIGIFYDPTTYLDIGVEQVKVYKSKEHTLIISTTELAKALSVSPINIRAHKAVWLKAGLFLEKVDFFNSINKDINFIFAGISNENPNFVKNFSKKGRPQTYYTLIGMAKIAKNIQSNKSMEFFNLLLMKYSSGGIKDGKAIALNTELHKSVITIEDKVDTILSEVSSPKIYFKTPRERFEHLLKKHIEDTRLIEKDFRREVFEFIWRMLDLEKPIRRNPLNFLENSGNGNMGRALLALNTYLGKY
jgi:hypothetical protein